MWKSVRFWVQKFEILDIIYLIFFFLSLFLKIMPTKACVMLAWPLQHGHWSPASTWNTLVSEDSLFWPIFPLSQTVLSSIFDFPFILFLPFLKILILFIYFQPCWVFVTALRPFSSCSEQASHCGGFSCCGTQGLGPVGFSTYGTRA